MGSIFIKFSSGLKNKDSSFWDAEANSSLVIHFTCHFSIEILKSSACSFCLQNYSLTQFVLNKNELFLWLKPVSPKHNK